MPGYYDTELEVRSTNDVVRCSSSQIKVEEYTLCCLRRPLSNEIYPVAFALINDNENRKMGLNLVRSSIDILAIDHPRSTVGYKYFSFVSDRQKGLINSNALARVLSENHSYFCSVHIARKLRKHQGIQIRALLVDHVFSSFVCGMAYPN
jgi:hypothetical protein